MAYIAIIALVISVGLAGFCTGLYVRTKNFEDTVLGKLASLAVRITDLEASIEDLPVDQFKEEAEKMAAWNSGVEEIMVFGKSIPKINKEGLKHE